MSCAICLDTCNKSVRAPTTCPYCNIVVCRTCLQTYLLNDISDTPKCVNPECNHGYTREFLDSQLTQSFRLHTYKLHREKVLIDREQSRLPSTQEDTQAYVKASATFKELSEKIVHLVRQIEALRTSEVKTAQYTVYRYEVMMYRLRIDPNRDLPDEQRIDYATFLSSQKIVQTFQSALHPLTRELRKLRRQTYQLKTTVTSFGRIRGRDHRPVVPVERQTFVKPCPAQECKGYLSTAWKCGLCEQWSCSECHELKGPTRETEHTCDSNKVLTIQLLQKEAKGCPKCGVQICKIEGCDQMWCTSCNTGFNWRTGKIAAGPVHNPHYFEWLRSQGLGQTEGQGQDLVQAQNLVLPPNTCDYTTDRLITRILGQTTPEDRYLAESWRTMRHFQDNPPVSDNEEKFRQLRVRFMAGELTKDAWKHTLQRLEKNVLFQQANSQIREVFVNATRDLIRQILEPDSDKLTIKKQVEQLVEYCNISADALTKRFHRQAQKYVVRVEAPA